MRAAVLVVALSTAAAMALLPHAARAQDYGAIAVAKGKGPTKGAAATVAKAIKAALDADGLTVIEAKPTGKKGKVDLKLARAVGARFLVLVDAIPDKKKFKARVTITDVDAGSTLSTFTSDPYAGKKDAPKLGRALAPDVAAAIRAAGPASPSRPKVDRKAIASSGGDDEEDEDDGADGAAAEAPAAEAPATPPVAPREAPAARADEPSDPTATPKVIDAPAAEPARGDGSLPMVEVSAGAGSQASTAYTVIVNGSPTALAYTLSPLFLIDARARVQIPSTQLGIEASFAWSPVKYALATTPPAVPDTPGGSFLDLGLTLGWRFWLSGDGTRREGLALEPIAGLRYESLSVDPQEPAIVLSHSTLVPFAGLRAHFGASDALIFHGDVRLRLPLAYSESNKTTGDGGSGFGVSFAAGARYWLWPWLGLGAEVGYTYNSVSFSGTGTRDRFANDPPLVDASVASSNLRVVVGPLVAF